MHSSDLQLTAKYRGQILIGSNGSLRFTAAGRALWAGRFSAAGISIDQVRTPAGFREAARRALQSQICRPMPAAPCAGSAPPALKLSNPISER